LRATRDARYGDSMERMMYNTVLGAMPLQENGDNFYYADYNFDGEAGVQGSSLGVLFRHAAAGGGGLPDQHRISAGPQAVYVNLYVPSTLQVE
jgi:DUF1680 family protein